MRLLALDLGTKTGWAFYDDLTTEHGVQDFSLQRGESVGMRFVKFRSWLTKMILSLRPDVILYEQAHMRGGAATDVLVGFTTRVQEVSEEINQRYGSKIGYTGVHSATIKKSITGSGRAEKKDMIEAASRIIRGPIKDDNEADAICLLEYGKKTIESKEGEFI